MSRLITLEAVVRTGSFKAAASDLYLTPSAISHQMRLLEEELGLKLFMKIGRNTCPTDSAHIIAKQVCLSLEAIHDAIGAVKDQNARGSFIITSSSVFALYCIIPMLQALKEAGVSPVSIHGMDQFSHLDTPQHHVAIRREPVAAAPHGRPDDVVVKERSVLVASPDIARGINKTEDVFEYTLLQEEHATIRELDWLSWSDELSMRLQSAPKILRVSHYTMCINAALQGQGIAIGRRPLVDADLKAGRLVQVHEKEHRLATRQFRVTRGQLSDARTDWFLEYIGGAIAEVPTSG